MEELNIETLKDMLLKEQDNSQNLKTKNDELLKSNEDLTIKNTKLTEYNNTLFARVAQQNNEEFKPQKELTEEEKEQKNINEVRKIMHPEEKGDK